MATRSMICKKTPDGKCVGIYCHWDGYPEGVGKTLVGSYSTPEIVDELLALGDISSLNDRLAPIGETHTFDTPELGVTVAYHRDRNEPLHPARPMTPGKACKSWCEYMYVFGLDGKWRYYDLYENRRKLLKLDPDIVGSRYYVAENKTKR